MKWIIYTFVIYAQVFLPSTVTAQEVMPYTFTHEQASRHSNKKESLELLTEVSVPSSSFVRLYFSGTQLGDESYLLLEGTDGAKQKLRKVDLENWRYSSAYFNGSSVKVYLSTGQDDENKISITSVKADNGKTKKTTRSDGTSRSPDNSQDQATVDLDAMPYAAAVGRFTNGSNSYGTGWIAPNGTIVTSGRLMQRLHEGYDVIEFNVPASQDFGAVSHPSPEFQFVVEVNEVYLKRAFGHITYGFKNKFDYLEENEDGYGDFYCRWAVLNALPNSTGLTPGEKIQEYFQIAMNPRSSTLNDRETKIEVDILHHGETLADIMDGGHYRTLKQHVTHLEAPNEYLDWSSTEKDDVVLYNLNIGDFTLSDSDAGAPIVHHGTKVAIGAHNDFYKFPPAGGCGFRNNEMLEALNYYFSDNVEYVDVSSPHDSPSGSIRAPHLTVNGAVLDAQDGAVISVAKGYYQLPVTIHKPVTLVAPVGTVIMGENGNTNARMATLPPGIANEDNSSLANDIDDSTDEPIGLDLTPYPNPFTTGTDVHYALPKTHQVKLTVFDHVGNMVKSLVNESKSKGRYAIKWDGTDYNGRQVTPGLYVIRIESGSEARSVKLLKR